MRSLALCLSLLCAGAASAAYNSDPSLTWRTLQTPHFAIHFHDGEETLAQQTAARAEAAHDRLSRFFSWTPATRTDVVLTDRYDFSNGWSTPFSHNTMTLIVAPPDDVTVLEEYDDWLSLLITHEYAHILHLDKSARAPRLVRKVLGRFPLLFPNLFQTTWQIEGIATYLETDDALGIGRGQSSYFRALMRLEVDQGIKPLRQVNQPLTSWPGGTTPYLYGVYFYRFAANRYGEPRLRKWIDATSGKLIPFMLNTNSRAAFGKDMDQLWREYTSYLSQQFQPELEAIRQRGLRTGERLTDSGYFTDRPRTLPNGDLIYLHSDQQNDRQLMLLKAGETAPRRIARVHGTRFDVHPTAGIVLAQTDNVNNANLLDDLYHVDPATGDITRLTHGGRYRYAAWSPDGTEILAVQYTLGQSRLQLLDRNGRVLDTLWEGKPWEVVADPAWSPDGQSVVAAVWRPDSRWNLELFDLNTRQWRALTRSADIESQPRFAPDGASIIFSADYNGVYNIQRLHLADGRRDTLTHVPGAAFLPELSADGATLYYANLGPSGTDIYRLTLPTDTAAPAGTPGTGPAITPYQPWNNQPSPRMGGISTRGSEALCRADALPRLEHATALDETLASLLRADATPRRDAAGEMHPFPNPDRPAGPEQRQWQAAAPAGPAPAKFAAAEAQYRDTATAPYRPWNSIRPAWWFPYLVVTDQRGEVGVTTMGNDALHRHSYSLLAGYDFTRNWPIASVDYFYDRWNPTVRLSAAHTITSYTDSQGEDTRLRASDTVSLVLEYPLLSYRRQWIAQAGLVVDNESDAWRRADMPAWLDQRDGLAGLALTYNSAQRYPRAVSDSHGQRLLLVAETSDALPSDYRGEVYRGDWRAYLPLGGQHVLAARLAAGVGTDFPNPFKLGGAYAEGDLPLPEPVPFNQRDFALRGYPEGYYLLTGRRMALGALEWRFPIKLIERGYMAPPIGVHQLAGTVFFNAGDAWNVGKRPDPLSRGAGVELNTDVVLGYRLELNLRLGYARGFDEGGENQVYLALGSAF